MKKLTMMLLVGGFLSTSAGAVWQPDPGDDLQLQSRQAVDRFREERAETLQRFFDEAYGYAIFPSVKRGGLLVGYSSGRGVVIEGGEFAGYAVQRRLSLGAQLGFQAQAQIIFFRDAEVLADFKNGNLEFSPQASASAGKAGGAADGGYDSRVAIFSLTKAGLMFEASAGVSKYKFKPAQ